MGSAEEDEQEGGDEGHPRRQQGPEPAVVLYGLLGDVGEDGVPAAEGDQRGAGEEDDLLSAVLPGTARLWSLIIRSCAPIIRTPRSSPPTTTPSSTS